MTSKTQELLEKLSNAHSLIPIKSTWKHYKGGIYRVKNFVISTIDGEVSVLYHRIDGPDFDVWAEQEIEYARPLSEWFEKIDVERIDSRPGGLNREMVSRFQRVWKVERWEARDESCI